MQGLVTTERNNLDPAAVPFAKSPRDIEGLTEGASIIEVVNATEFKRKPLLALVCYLWFLHCKQLFSYKRVKQLHVHDANFEDYAYLLMSKF